MDGRRDRTAYLLGQDPASDHRRLRQRSAELGAVERVDRDVGHGPILPEVGNPTEVGERPAILEDHIDAALRLQLFQGAAQRLVGLCVKAGVARIAQIKINGHAVQVCGAV